jgi:putative PEP-CTERM system TPR-repeat lipoprotein
VLADAEARFAAGDYRAALILVQNVLQLDVNNIGARVLLGEIALAGGDFTQASVQLERARDLGASPEQFAVPLATSLVEINEAERALDVLDAVPAESRDAEYWVARGHALIAAGAYGEATQAFATAEEQGGETAPLLVERARLAGVQGDAANAEELLDRALNLDSLNPEALALRGALVTTAGRLAEGATDLGAAADLYERRSQVALAAPVLLRLVQVQLALNDVEAAATTAQRLSSAFPGGAFADYANGLVAFQRGDYTETIRLLRDALTKAPDMPQLLALLGAAHLGAGNFGQAEQQFLAILSDNPSDPAAIRLLAETRIRQQRPQAALEALELFDAPDIEEDLGLLLLQSTARLQGGDVAGAIPYLEQAVALDPGNQSIVVQLLHAYVSTGRTAQADELARSSPALTLDEAYSANVAVLLALLQNDGVEAARAYVDELVSERPRDARAQLLRATFEQLTNDRIAARASIDRALELDSAFVPARLARAALLMEEGRLEDAEDELLEVTRLDADNEAALLSLAQLVARRSDFDAAEEYLTRAARGSESAVAQIALARVHLAQGEIASAEEQVGLAASLAPGAPDVLITQGMLALAKADTNAAVTFLRDAWTRSPNRPSVALLYAEAQAANADIAGARATLASAASAMPSVPELRAALGAAALRAGDSTEALRTAQALQVEFPQRAIGYALEARLRMTERRYAEAERLYTLAYSRERSWELLASLVAAKRLSEAPGSGMELVNEWLVSAPGDVRARLLLAELLQATGSAEAALAEYARILEINPDNAVALNNAAWYAYELARPEALTYAQRAARLAPDNAAILDTLGWILTRENRAAEGLEHLTKATQLAPQAFEIRYHLGVAQAQAGQTDAARATLRAVLDEGRPFAERDAAEALLETL